MSNSIWFLINITGINLQIICHGDKAYTCNERIISGFVFLWLIQWVWVFFCFSLCYISKNKKVNQTATRSELKWIVELPNVGLSNGSFDVVSSNRARTLELMCGFNRSSVHINFVSSKLGETSKLYTYIKIWYFKWSTYFGNVLCVLVLKSWNLFEIGPTNCFII